MSSNDGILLNDELWERLFTLTHGAAALCYQCGECTAACPWGLVREQTLPVRTLLRQAQLGMQKADANLWLCTTCGQCQATCPRGVDIPAVFRALRQLAWEQRQVEKGLPSLLWSLYWNNNPWSQAPSHRSAWAKNLNLPLFNPDQHEILLYVGCTSSYNRRAQKIARALVNILLAARISFGYLGDEEPCCGESALSVGNLPYFEEIVAQTAQKFKDCGVSRMITISPHCYDTFKNHYTGMDARWQPQHYTQYLAEILDEGRISFSQPFNARLTFQDPCYLGRLNNEYDAPRKILSAIPGIEFVEMEPSHRDGLCCGGGGGRMWLETPPGERFSDLRIQQAVQTRSKYLVTACPFCLACLEDSAAMLPAAEINILDVAEVAQLALQQIHT